MTELIPMLVVFCAGAAAAVAGLCLTTRAKRCDEREGMRELTRDTERFDWLSKNRHSLMFNSHVNLWAVLDSHDKPVSAGPTPRAVIDKAAKAEGVK